MTLLFIKIICCMLGAAIGISAHRSDWWHKYQAVTILLCGFGWRWLLLAIWFFVLGGHVSGDVSGHEMHVNWVLDGKVPNRDFTTPYGVYMNYIFAIPYSLTKHPASIVFFVQLIELIGVFLLWSTFKKTWSETKAKLYVLLYVSNPLIISWFAFDGQEESMLIFGFALIVYALSSTNLLLRWMLPAILILCVKITSLWMILSFALVQRVRDWGGMAAMFILALVPAIIAGSSIFGFVFSREGNAYDDLAARIFPGNFWFIINSFYEIPNAPMVSKILTAIALLAASLLLMKLRCRHEKLIFLALGTTILTMIFQIFSAYTSPGFLAPTIPAILIILLVVNRVPHSLLIPNAIIAWSFLASLDMALYYRFPDFLKVAELHYFKILYVGYEGMIVIGNLILLLWVLHTLVTGTRRDDVGSVGK